MTEMNAVAETAARIFADLADPQTLARFVQNLGDYRNGLVLKTFDLYVYTGGGAGKSGSPRRLNAKARGPRRTEQADRYLTDHGVGAPCHSLTTLGGLRM